MCDAVCSESVQRATVLNWKGVRGSPPRSTLGPPTGKRKTPPSSGVAPFLNEEKEETWGRGDKTFKVVQEQICSEGREYSFCEGPAA